MDVVLCGRRYVQSAAEGGIVADRPFNIPSCVDAWLLHNRVCPVCRVDVEASAAQFRSDWPLLSSNIDN